MITKKPWFKAKKYGWGWTPSTWQGWLITAVFLYAIISRSAQIDSASHSVSDTLFNLVPDTVILVVALIGICYLTGEPPKWRWGDKD